jgi:dihydroorotase
LKYNISENKGYVLLQGGDIYDPYIDLASAGDILIKDGFIEKISKYISPDKKYKVINCKNKIITNGFIDLHAHFREPGFELKETLESGSRSAFYGGYTRVCTMPNTNPVVDSPELVQLLIKKSELLPIYIYPIGAITKNQLGQELSEIGSMVKSGAVAISDDGIPVSNSQMMRFALEYAKKFNIPVINHAEDNCLVNEGLMHEGHNSLKLGLPGNPGIAESSMVFRDISIAEYVGGRLHIPHVSSYKSVEIIKLFKDRGVDVTAEVTPHHLCLTDDILLDYNTDAKVAPPIRSNEDRRALIEAVKSGLINCIATDHAPHTIEDKETDMFNSCCGMIGLESAFGLVNKCLSKEKMSIESIIDLFSLNPSKIIGIEPVHIKENNQAEINIVDPKSLWSFEIDHIQSKSKNTPILGMNLKGQVIATLNKGYIAVKK